MCGRKYSHEGLSWEEYCDLLRLIPSAPPPANFQPNYTIAPTHEVPVCIAEEGERRLELLRWGLVPHWAKESKVGYRMINARAETLSEKPSFKSLLKSRRAIVAVSGFYEWKRDGKDKQAHKIEHSSGKPMMMAALCPGPKIMSKFRRSPNAALRRLMCFLTNWTRIWEGVILSRLTGFPSPILPPPACWILGGSRAKSRENSVS